MKETELKSTKTFYKKRLRKNAWASISLIALMLCSIFAGAVSASAENISENQSDNTILNETELYDDSNTLNSSDNYSLSSKIDTMLNDKPVFLFFYTDWCHFCQEQKPIIDELEQEYADKIAFIRVNADENPHAVNEFGVTGFPAMFLIVDKSEFGYVYQGFRGFTEKEALKKSFDYVIENGSLPEGFESSSLQFNQTEIGNFSIVSQENLTLDEFKAELANDSEFKDLHDYARELGYIYPTVVRKTTFSNGFIFTEVTMTSTNNESIFLYRYSLDNESCSVLMKIDNTSLTIFNKNGFVRIDGNGSVSIWPEHHSCDRVQCFLHCSGEATIPDKPEELVSDAIDCGGICGGCVLSIVAPVCKVCLASILFPTVGEETLLCLPCLKAIAGCAVVCGACEAFQRLKAVVQCGFECAICPSEHDPGTECHPTEECIFMDAATGDERQWCGCYFYDLTVTPYPPEEETYYETHLTFNEFDYPYSYPPPDIILYCDPFFGVCSYYKVLDYSRTYCPNAVIKQKEICKDCEWKWEGFEFVTTCQICVEGECKSSDDPDVPPGNDKPDENYDVSTPKITSDSTFDSETRPEVAILFKGFPISTQKLLADFNEPTVFVDVGFSPNSIDDYPILIIPTGGLYGLDSLPTFKSNLEQYVKDGGTLIVFSQQHGYEYNVLPGGNLSGFGWLEDQSCHHRSVYIDTYHPILSGQDSVTLDVVVDGYFTKWPENSTILLRRTKNGMPAMLMYKYGNGTVIASTIYEDWAYTHYQSTQDGKNLVRDMIAWAKDRTEISEYGKGDTVNISVNVTNVHLPIPEIEYPRYELGDTVNISINVTNYANLTSDKVSFSVFDPDYEIDYVNVSVSIPANESKIVNFTYPTTNESKRGTYFVLYSLYAGETVIGGGFGGGFALGVNTTNLSTYKVNFTLIDPDKQIVKQDNISVYVPPGEIKTVNFTYANPSKLGIWQLKYEISDYNNTLIDWGMEKFAVSKYAENPKGFVYQGKKITFTVSSPEEKYAYGSDVPFTIHIWNKGDTDRTISFKTYYKDWMLSTKLPEQNVEGTLEVPAGGEASATYTLHVGDIYLSHNQLIIYASFYEDGSYLGRTEKVVYMFHPSVDVKVETDGKEYAIGDDVSVLLNLTNKRSAACNATVIVRVLDPDNNKVFENTFYATLSAFESLTKTLTFTLPTTSEYGVYLVSVEAYTDGRKIGSGSAYFEVKRGYIVKMSFDKPDRAYRVRDSMSFELEVKNTGSSPWSSSINISIPALAFEDSKYVSLNPNETKKFNYNLNVPETTPAGKHDVIVTISYDNAVKKYYFVIPDSKLILSSEKTSYNAGDYLGINLVNVGGVDTIYNCSIRFSDSKGFVVYDNSTQGIILAGENKTIEFEIPEQAVDGEYYLMAECKDLNTSEITTLSKSYTISGLKAVLTSVTDKKAYFSDENISIITNITNLDGEIVNGTLNLKVFSVIPVAPELPLAMSESTNQESNSVLTTRLIEDSIDSVGEITLNNGIISLTLNDWYEHNLVYDESNFMEVTGGGTTWALRVDNDLYGFHFAPCEIVSPITQISPLSASVEYLITPYDLPIEGITINKTITLSEDDKYYDVRFEVTNNNDVPVSNVKLYQYMEPNVDYSNEETAAYEKDYDLIYGYNLHYLGFSFLDCMSSKHDISLGSDQFIKNMISDTLNNQNGPVYGDSWLTEEVDIGTINPGETIIKTVRIAVGDSLADIKRVFVRIPQEYLIWEKNITVNISEFETKDILTNINIPSEMPGVTGKLELIATLYNNINSSQVINQSSIYSFFITDKNTSLILETDKEVYKPNETITIYGEVKNNAELPDDYNLSIKKDGEEILSANFTLDPGQTYSFTTSTSSENSFILEGSVDGVIVTDFVRVEKPDVNVSIIAPDIVGIRPFDIGISIENIGNISAELNVTLENNTWNITIPEKESRLITTTMSIKKNTTLNVTISGDVNKTIQKEIICGENAKINITPQPTYLEGIVEIPFTIENIGLLDSEFNATFSIDNQTVSRSFFVPKGQNITDSVSFNLTKGAHILKYISPFEEVNVTINILSPPDFVITSIYPADMEFLIGENVTITFEVENVGGTEGEATIRLLMPDFEDTNRTWIRPGERENISFRFKMPDDLEERRYKGIYEIEGRRGEFYFFVYGANISVNASLDKNLYEENETAILILNITNECPLNLSLYARVKLGGYEEVKHFNLTDFKTLKFYVPVHFNGQKLFYGIYMESGRALYLNAMYVHKKEIISLYTDKQVYNAGENVTIFVETTESGILNITAPGFNKSMFLTGSAVIEFELPKELRSGTYYIDYTFDNFSAAYPFDVIGYSARILECNLDKEVYNQSDVMIVNMNVETNKNISGVLKSWIYDPEDNLIKELEIERNFVKGENKIEIVLNFSSNLSGIHALVYGIYAHSDLIFLASGAEYFDVKGINAPPIANANGPYAGIEGQPVEFNASLSYDPEGMPLTYYWEFGDGETAVTTQPKITHIYAQEGNYTVTLIVNDSVQNSTPSITYALINDTEPKANFTANITSGFAPLTVQFNDSSVSYDGIIAWEWDFNGDGIVDSNEQNPTHTYDEAGTYTVSLTVYEADGDSDTETKTDYITVTSAADTEPPTIESVTLDTYINIPNASFHVTVEATDNVGVTSVTADGVTLTKTGSTWEGDIFIPEGTPEGEYTLTITAQDEAGNTAESSVNYSVVFPQGGFAVAIDPMMSSASAGDVKVYQIKIISNENFDDKLHVYISDEGIPDAYKADFEFNWTDKTIYLRSGETVELSLEVTIPQASGMKMFRVYADSMRFRTSGYCTGIVLIS